MLERHILFLGMGQQIKRFVLRLVVIEPQRVDRPIGTDENEPPSLPVLRYLFLTGMASSVLGSFQLIKAKTLDALGNVISC